MRYIILTFFTLISLGFASATGMCVSYWWRGIITIDLLIICAVMMGVSTTTTYMYLRGNYDLS